MRYTDLNSSLEAHISTLRAVIAVLILIILGLWVGWQGSNNDTIKKRIRELTTPEAVLPAELEEAVETPN